MQTELFPTPAAIEHEDRVRFAVSRNLSLFAYAGAAIIVALPIALVGVPGPLRITGLIYAILYVIVLTPTTLANMLLMLDGFLLLTNRDAVLLPHSLASMRLEAEGLAERRVIGFMHDLASFTMFVNPSTPLALTVVFQAVRLSPEAIPRLKEQTDDIVRSWHITQRRNYALGEPSAQFSRPVIERIKEVEPDLVAC
jgi:hypothetical protein